MKVVSSDGLTELIQLSKNNFLDKNNVIQGTTIQLATVATSGSYNDLANKPSIPTVNNSTITITQGGVTKGSFTLNQASGDTIALDAGGGSSLPSQTGQSGKFLTTNGTDASWANVPTEIPSQTGNSGKFLTTNGTSVSWATVSGGGATLTYDSSTETLTIT